ncbi:hypothetical protein [Denitrobaculum tricleocarpae]|uniref:Transmembrane protein n=1 Tax=Denitrobaculum tricleocarpae TaxID=2591009 RepID=A0A545TMF8_9PROT|nr:hypothetical protein [Denitrobaculum tricleocarpae]TQV78419.1 hypothetical protein FKG95_17800 [Denitrobaculum tricleocarpae]
MAVDVVNDEFEEEEFELQASDLDDLTHAELLMLYTESANSIRFAKAQQWKSVGATLLVFAGLMLVAHFAKTNIQLVKTAAFTSFLFSAAALYTLVLYQVWQNTEREKLREIAKALSNLFVKIRTIKSSREANYHRYTLLCFMAVAILLGNAILIMDLQAFYQ